MSVYGGAWDGRAGPWVQAPLWQQYQLWGMNSIFFFYSKSLDHDWVFLVHSVSSFALSQDKVHIPGAIFLSVKFDSRCHTEEGCDELLMASSSDFLQDLHTFSGSHQKWTDFEIPGESLRKWHVWVLVVYKWIITDLHLLGLEFLHKLVI